MNDTLKYFFEAYFHQDWRDDYSSSMEAVKAFNNEEPLESKIQLKNEILHLLQASNLPQNTINNLGGNFKPETEGLSVNSWFEMVVKIIS